MMFRKIRLLAVVFWAAGASLGLFAQAGGGTGPGGAGFGGPSGGGGGAPGASGFLVTARTEQQGRTLRLAGRTLPLRRISHSTPLAGTVERILVQPGAQVRTGQALIVLNRENLGDSFRPVTIESRLNGQVSDILVLEGDEVRAAAALIWVIDTSRFVLDFAVSDRDVQSLRRLGSASLNLESADGRVYHSQLVHVSPEPDYATGLYKVRVEVPAQPGLFLGQTLFADWDLDRSSGLFVEANLLRTVNGRTGLWVLNTEDRLEFRPVRTGIELAGRVPILEGLQPGERYLGRLTGREEPGLSLRDLRPGVRNP